MFWIARASFFEGNLTRARCTRCEILAHKKLKGSLRNNSCEFKENQTILSSPKCPSTLLSFLRVLPARMIFVAFRPYDQVLWLKTDLLWKYQQKRIITNTFCRRGLDRERFFLCGLPYARKMFKTEIWAHKKLKGSLRNNSCELQDKRTILSSPKCLARYIAFCVFYPRGWFLSLSDLYVIRYYGSKLAYYEIFSKNESLQIPFAEGFGLKALFSLRVVLRAQDFQNWNMSSQKVERVIEEWFLWI